ncbi:MAG: reverse transcriptase/maturase family protein [Patescibacteria group bacterium]
MKIIDHIYPKIISIDNLLIAWQEFALGKKKKADVQIFSKNILANILSLRGDLINLTYKHSSYQQFNINDPKARVVHKAIVRDRLLHHAVYRILYPLFDQSFIYDSYSCRLDKGTHRAVKRLESFTRKVSKNYTRPCFALKCDVKKFFDSVDHKILMCILEKKITDSDTLRLLGEIICSFDRSNKSQLSLFDNWTFDRFRLTGKGIPIGNLTSQLFANVYLNELDKFVKHKLKVKYYLRYCDDFIILSSNENYLNYFIILIESFLMEKLKLKLHENKVFIRKLKQGIDFLGYVVLPYHIVLRTKTRKRIFKRINNINVYSYLGLIKHCDGYLLVKKIFEKFKFNNFRYILPCLSRKKRI